MNNNDRENVENRYVGGGPSVTVRELENHSPQRVLSRETVNHLCRGDSNSRYQIEPSWCCRSRLHKILLVHGLDHIRPAINCDRVFNLFCLYGNVCTVKMLKDNKVLVELEDAVAAKRCVSNLHLLPLDDSANKMKVKYSKHSFIYDQVIFNTLPDGTPTQKVYLASKLNRFSGNGICLDRRRVAAPSKILHFFNAPTDVCGLTIHKTISDVLGRTDAIKSITILPKRPGAKCSTGLIELKNIGLAVKTVLLANHMTFESTKSRFPFLTKLCFSKWSEIQRTSAESATLQFSSAPRIPWLLHMSEHMVPTTEFPISQTTVVNVGGGGDDGSWTLWLMNDDEATVNVVANDDDDGQTPSQTQPVEKILQQFPNDIGKFLLAMLRTQLCGKNDDQGDVLIPVTRADQEDEAAAVVRVNIMLGEFYQPKSFGDNYDSDVVDQLRDRSFQEVELSSDLQVINSEVDFTINNNVGVDTSPISGFFDASKRIMGNARNIIDRKKT